jgi:hypothetical protein
MGVIDFLTGRARKLKEPVVVDIGTFGTLGTDGTAETATAQGGGVASSPTRAETAPGTETGTATGAATDGKDGKAGIPAGMSEEAYGYLTANGFSPEAIAGAYAPYNPERDGGYLTRIYQSNVTKPQHAERSASALSIASLGDALRTLGELYGASRGAHVSRRGQEGYSLPEVEKRSQRREEKYGQDLLRWQAGLARAMGNDYTYGQKTHESNRDAVQKALKGRMDAEIKREDMLQKQYNADRNYELNVQKADAVQRNADRNYQLAATRTQSAVARNKAYIARTGSGGGTGGGKKQDVLYIPARADDPNAVTDRLGQKVVAIPLTEGQREYLYTQGVNMLRNGTFTPENHPELFERKESDSIYEDYRYEPTKDKAVIAAAAAAAAYGASPRDAALPAVQQLAQEDASAPRQGGMPGLRKPTFRSHGRNVAPAVQQSARPAALPVDADPEDEDDEDDWDDLSY